MTVAAVSVGCWETPLQRDPRALEAGFKGQHAVGELCGFVSSFTPQGTNQGPEENTELGWGV